ncbi:MAG: Do family serine endopeptidase [Candidatus Omnitrophica bacterium]|jgi:serine protease Do|nr:Do family serine endopeptidase [Candidatus Omnitrophota bacterium]
MKNKIFLYFAVFSVLSFLNVQAQNLPAVNSAQGQFSLQDAVINVASTVGKAVVSISTEKTEKIGVPGKSSRRFYFNRPFGNNQYGQGQEEFFDRFFEDFFGDMPEREFKQKGLGSGVIISEDGFILTNEHVISGADKITVTLSDGREFKAELKGQDVRSDLAVIKISAGKNIPYAKLGSSDSLRIGEWVVAIGNPYAFVMQNPEPTVTTGVISALHRSLGRTMSGQDRDYNDLIQTDAAINPGNSGGPLVNLKGEVVGINVAIFSTSGGYQGIGFAVASNKAQKILARLIEGKKIVYGWLGISVQDLKEDLVTHFGLPDANGALVAKVMENAPAEKAGLKAGDVIKAVAGKPVNNVRVLLDVAGALEPGKTVKLELIRDKKPMSLDVVVGERPILDKEEQAQEAVPAEEEKWRGISVQQDKEKKDVVIVNIQPGSPADQADLIPGDVILEINKLPIKNLEDYHKVVKDLKGDCLVRTNRGFFVLKENN